jgi:hypothetical protein
VEQPERVAPSYPLECTRVEALVGLEAHDGELRRQLGGEREVAAEDDVVPADEFG